MAWFRSRRSPYQADDRVRGDLCVVGLADRALRLGQRRAGRQQAAVRAVERKRVASGGWRGDEVAAVVHHLVVPRAQADQVGQVGAAAVDPVLDVVQVHPAGLTAREPAPDPRGPRAPAPGGPAFPRKRPRADHPPGRRRRPAAPSAAPRPATAAAWNVPDRNRLPRRARTPTATPETFPVSQFTQPFGCYIVATVRLLSVGGGRHGISRLVGRRLSIRAEPVRRACDGSQNP
jgi:hypothetical protein